MNQIIFLAAEFDHKFQILENYFNTLTTSQKNYIKKDNENDNTTSSSSSTSLPLPPPSQPSSISSIESKSEFESSQLQSELPPPLPPNTTNNHNLPTKIESDEEIVARFHLLADEVVDILNQLQPLVKSIQSHLPENSGKINYYSNMIFSLFSHDFIDEMIVKKEDDESDFAPKPNSLPRPKWLEILLQKYINRQTPTSGTTSSSTKNSFVLPPIGTFSSFLSCCVTEQIDCVKIEYDALVEVIFFFFIFIFIY